MSREEALAAHQGMSHPGNQSVGFCPAAIATPFPMETLTENRFRDSWRAVGKGHVKETEKASENMEEWGSSAWVELETIRSTIEAFARGEIDLPEVPKNTPKNLVREVRLGSDLVPYTKAMIADCLKWTKKNNDLLFRVFKEYLG